jgi:diguanylate cyclase (GGDEF)-like protein
VILPDTAGRAPSRWPSASGTASARAQFLASDGLSIHLTASIGVATLPDVAASAEELLRVADVAMYRVKDAGKDGIHIAREAFAS